MVELEDDKLDQMLDFLVHKVPKGNFNKIALDIYSKLKDTKNGAEFKTFVAKRLKDSSFHTKLSHDDLIELANRLDFGPVYHAVARRFPEDQRKDLFPGVSLYEVSAPSGNKLNQLVKFIVNPELKENEAYGLWEKMLQYLNMKPVDVIKVIADELSKKNKLGLNEKELLLLADRVDDPLLKKAVFQNLSASDQKSNVKLSEDEITDKDLSWMEKVVIKELLRQGKEDIDQTSALLQKMAGSDNAPFLGVLQKKLDAKDLIILAQKIISLKDSEQIALDADMKEAAPPGPSNASFTSTANTAPYAVPLGEPAPGAKRKKKRKRK